MKALNILYFVVLSFVVYSQPPWPCENPSTSNCINAISGSSEFIMSTPSEINFVFDNINKYMAGITYSAKTQLRLRVDAANSNCTWKLLMFVDNNDGIVNLNEWEELVAYGNQGDIPEFDLIEVRVFNGCGTPLNSGVYQTFSGNTQYDILEIIPYNLVQYPPGNCDGNSVNTSGSYLTNYNEYNFTIDYRIKPNPSFRYKPGAYQIKIHFCLVEAEHLAGPDSPGDAPSGDPPVGGKSKDLQRHRLLVPPEQRATF